MSADTDLSVDWNAPPPDDGPNYLQAVTDMAERCQVVAHSAIYNANGIKLVEQGARIDARLYDRLVQHRLQGSIDGHLSAENAVDIAAIQALARQRCQEPLLQRMVQAVGGEAALLAPLAAVPLPAPLAFKLTVMREQQPALLAHSVGVMLVALYLGLRTGLAQAEASHLAAAALLHDIGVLHMDPVWRDPSHKVAGPGRKHLVAHPVTAMLLVRAQPAYPPAVAQAVLEHHERLDGTGYPRGTPGADISPLGHILLLAEVVDAFFGKYRDHPAQRLSLMLRLNHRKFPPALVALVLPLLADESTAGADAPTMQAEAERHAAVLAQTFERWIQLRAPLVGKLPAPGAFIDQRLGALHKALIAAGAHPHQLSDMLPLLQGDGQGLAELALVGREALWQLQAIVHAVQRRWPHLGERTTAADAACADWCTACEQGLGGSAASQIGL